MTCMVWQETSARRVPQVAQDQERLVRVDLVVLC